jgi:hypothetical protein
MFEEVDYRGRKGMAKAKKKVIITCAVTGAIHTPSMSPHLPVTADEIAAAAIGAARAGSGIAEYGVDEFRTVFHAGSL